MRSLTITVKPNGESQIEANGFEGASCTTATMPYIQRLGGKQTKHTIKDEMYQQVNQEQQRQ